MLIELMRNELRFLGISVLSCSLLACGCSSPSACADPEPILQAGTTTESGFVNCADGFVHRAQAVTCVAPATPGTCQLLSNNKPQCATDVDCNERPYGSCSNSPFGDCECSYGCATDADCDPGKVCACAGVVGGRAQCIPATCAASGECSDGLCGLSVDIDSCDRPHGRLGCYGAGQECRVDADCASKKMTYSNESFECRLVDESWSCTPPAGSGPCG